MFEARNRVGGRVLSIKLNDSVAELGGENISDGFPAKNIKKLAKDLGIEIL